MEQDGDLPMTNSDDMSFLTRPLIDAYLETCVALMVPRIPEVQDLISASLPEAVVSTSYAADHENLVINVMGMLESMRAEGLDNVRTLQHSFRQANRIFLGAMWDAPKQHRRFDEIKTEPVMEFLRHVRNASSHGGRLNFVKLERPATWRDKEITESMSGTPVFPDLLQDGDPILPCGRHQQRLFRADQHIRGLKGVGATEGLTRDMASRAVPEACSGPASPPHPPSSRQVTRVFGVPLGVPGGCGGYGRLSNLSHPSGVPTGGPS